MNKFTDRACVYYRAWRESERTCTSSNRVKSSSRIICQLAKKSPLQKNTPKKKKKNQNQNQSRIRLKMMECDEAMNTPHKSLPCIYLTNQPLQ